MTNYPLANLFFTMMYLFLWILWIFLLVRIASDIFRSRDMSGWARAAWLILIIVLPFVGVLAYVIIRGVGMGQRESERAQANEQAVRSYIRDAAGPTSSVDDLIRLADLRDKGVITEEEFSRQKAKVLA